MLNLSTLSLACALSLTTQAALPAASTQYSTEEERQIMTAERAAQIEMDHAEADAAQSTQLASLGDVALPETRAMRSSRCGIFEGKASWYAARNKTTRTASGEYYSSGALTAAHRTLPFGTMVRVKDRNSGRSVIVRINDRGPFIGGRVIDLSKAAARSLGMDGLANVSVETCL